MHFMKVYLTSDQSQTSAMGPNIFLENVFRCMTCDGLENTYLPSFTIFVTTIFE